MITTDTLISAYQILSSYIPEKDRRDAASSLIAEIAEHPNAEKELRIFAGSDKYLLVALREYLGEEDDDEVDSYTEDDIDYD
jgi:hypothetical protein